MTARAAPQIRGLAILSDVSVGYGSPQVLSLAQSLAQHWNVAADLYEPDQPERPPVEINAPGVNVRRIYTATHPHWPAGRTEFCLALLDALNRTRPDVIVFFAFIPAPVLARLAYRPRAVIYYAYEHTDGHMPAEERLFQSIADKIDFIIFPEENRALLDAPRLGLWTVPKGILFNSSFADVEWKNTSERNGRLFYGGTISRARTFGDWFLGGALDHVPIDMFGLIDGYPDPQQVLADLQDRQSRVSYYGYTPAGRAYLDRLSHYCFSLVVYAPDQESTRFAAPNKFFDAIAAGVPPIVAPHPQCVSLVHRYRCGIAMEDFTLTSLLKALAKAQAIIRGGELERLVLGCREAQNDLSWETQFAKLVPFLDRVLWSSGV
ncbi:glycosyltransferase [Siccirubricoccus sp. G192]|uniref:glycosyltransferase n=1 Tax=Siccirubricoccus sp. G192 TaxID=2849651 RepID=UPI001C2C52DB|nr:glycosyltransferase [Siccirubricoccus sp. G192]MBV1798743.1 hypothetical protein [Siccirubricoccus sp. G192]